MTLAYENDQQIINDAAQMLLEAHLILSGSNEGMPSKDLANIHRQTARAFIEADFTEEEWEALSEEEQMFKNAKANLLFAKAAQLADRKWEAAMTLLGIEQ